MAILKIKKSQTLGQKTTGALKLAVAFAITAEMGMAFYTELFPDTYKNYIVTSCTPKQGGEVELTATGKGDNKLSWNQRTFETTSSRAASASLSCPMTSGEHRLRTCDIETTGQYIPLISVWPDVKSIKCKLATYEERAELENAVEYGYVSDDMVWGIMKNDRQP